MKTKSKTCQFCQYWDNGTCLLFESHEPFGDWFPKEQKKWKLVKKKACISTTILTGENADSLTEDELDNKKDVRIYSSFMTDENFGCNEFKKIE